MNPITCNIIRDLLPLYAEGEASADTQALVEEHLAECSACAAQLEELKAPLAVPPETEQRIMARLRRKRRNRLIRNSIIAVILVVLLVVLPVVSVMQDTAAELDASDILVETTSTGQTRLQLSDRARGGVLNVIYTQDEAGNATAYVSLQNGTRLSLLPWRFYCLLYGWDYYSRDELMDVYDITWTLEDGDVTGIQYDYTSAFGNCDSVVLSDAFVAVYYQPGMEEETGPFSVYMSDLTDTVFETASSGGQWTEEQLDEMVYSHYEVPESEERTLIWEKETDE
ncbi:MAG: zf-HC2 domain-containing protein [Clostridiales bacterium]|nr:zf-HC2 domain-containing protein [Clostridiales bacterium]